MEITTQEIKHIELITVKGRVDSVEAARLAQALESASRRGKHKIVVDMGEVEYMSSVGYGPLITFRARVRDLGGRLVLCRLTPVVKEMFETTRLLINPQSPKSLFEFTGTLEEATALVRS